VLFRARSQIRIAESLPICLGSPQGVAGSLRDQTGLELRHSGELRQHELAHWPGRNVGEVAESHALVPYTFQDREKEAGIAGKAIELRYHQYRPTCTAGCQRSLKLGTICPPSAFNLRELSLDRTSL
jgi:hypothetical protein